MAAILLLLGCMPMQAGYEPASSARTSSGSFIAYETADGRTRVLANSCSQALLATVETTDPAMAQSGPPLAGLVEEAASAIRSRCDVARDVRIQGTLNGYQSFYARTGADTGWQLAEFTDIATMNARNQQITTAEANRIRAQGGFDNGGDSCGYGAVFAGHPGAVLLDSMMGGAAARACQEDRQRVAERQQRAAARGSACRPPPYVVYCRPDVQSGQQWILGVPTHTTTSGYSCGNQFSTSPPCGPHTGYCNTRTRMAYSTEAEMERDICGS